MDICDQRTIITRPSDALEEMPDEAAQHRIKAEACRRLADLAEDAGRRAMWDERAVYWERLAGKAKKLPQRQKPSET
jgi:hypothetical protein